MRRRGQDNEASRQVKVHTGQRPFDHFKLPKKSVKYLFIPKEFYTYYSYTVKLNLLSFTPPWLSQSQTDTFHYCIWIPRHKHLAFPEMLQLTPFLNVKVTITLQSPPSGMASLSMQNLSPVPGSSGSSLHTRPGQQGGSRMEARTGSEEAHMWKPAVWQPGSPDVTRSSHVTYLLHQQRVREIGAWVMLGNSFWCGRWGLLFDVSQMNNYVLYGVAILKCHG